MSEENPYQPPESEIADVFTTSDAGGSLSHGIAGDYDFKILDVIQESWTRTKGMKRAYWGGMVIFLLIVFGVMLLMAGLGLFGDQPGMLGDLASNLIFTAVIYPFLTGIIMMGVYRAVDLPVYAGQVFGYLGSTLVIIVASVATMVLTNIGFVLLILPGIYLTIAYALTIPLVIDKQLGAWKAMEASRKAITRRWFKVFGLFLLMGGILLISMLSVVGLFWALPMSSVLLGILYRIVFGVERARINGTTSKIVA